MKTLIQRQTEAIALMSQPRTSAKRETKMHRSVMRQYRQQAEKMGYTKEQIEHQQQDIRDMYRLELAAE